ncbi:MAG: hypothetical protein F9K31_10930 [Dokdonella sp.]|nr:MAG: hypothetical protein F9K31_10930 [Dokdonella sp.]
MTQSNLTRAALFIGMQACCGLAASHATAGVLYGVEYRSYNGRSGFAASSTMEVARDGYFGIKCLNGGAGKRKITWPLDVPAGHEIFDVRIWGDDVSDSNDLDFELVERCQPYASGDLITHTVLGSAGSSGSGGRFEAILGLPSHPVQPSTCTYTLEATFAAAGAACDGSNLTVTRLTLITNDPDVIFRDAFDR